MKIAAGQFQEVLKKVISWLPVVYSETEVADILANFVLNPQSVPTSQISLDIYQAFLKDELKKKADEKENWEKILKVPDNVIAATRNYTEALMIVLDGVQPTGAIDIEAEGARVATCFCFEGVINAKNLNVKVAQVSVDFGIAQKQKLEVFSDQISKVPLRVGFNGEVTIKTASNFKIGGKKDLKSKVEGSEIGLVFDGRGRPIIAPGEAGDRLKRVNSWKQELETAEEFKLEDAK